MIPSARLRTLLAARRLRHHRRAADHPSVRRRGLCLPRGPESPAFGAWLQQRDPDTGPESERRSTGGRLSSAAAATADTRPSGIPGTAQFHSCTERVGKTYLTGSRPTSRQGGPTEAAPVASAHTRGISTSRAMSSPAVESCDAPREQASVSDASLPYATGAGMYRTGPRARRVSAPRQRDCGRSHVIGRPLNGDTGAAHALPAALPAPPEGN